MQAIDRESLLERLRGIEWDDFEVKEAAGGVPKSAYETVSAFANTSGGWLVFGVKETKAGFVVTGLVNPELMQGDFIGTCRNLDKFSRPVELRPHQFAIDSLAVLAFYVVPSRRFDKPLRLKTDKGWSTYIRVGSSDQRCSPQEEARFMRDASTETFDGQVLDGAKIDDLDPKSVQWVRAVTRDRHPSLPLATMPDAEFLEELGLVRDQQITNAAALLLGTSRLVLRIKPAGLVDFRMLNAPFSETPSEQRYDDRELFEGNITQALRGLIERFTRLIPQPFQVDATTMQRSAHPPEYRALREALVNLLGHQDYSDSHRTACIAWYRDRTTFSNPGDSFVSLAEMISGGASDLRNPRIVRVLRHLGFAEQAGSGIPSIIREWRSVDRVPPEVINDPGKKTYNLVLGWDRVQKRESGFWMKLLGASISPDEARLLDWLRRVEVGDRANMRLATGRSLRETQAMLERLSVNRLVEVVGDEGDRYRLVPHITEILAKVGPDDDVARDQVGIKSGPSRDQVEPKSELDALQQKVLAALAAGPAGAAALMTAVGRRNRSKLRELALEPLLTKGLLTMTLPDKPRSSLQQYQLTAAGRDLVPVPAPSRDQVRTKPGPSGRQVGAGLELDAIHVQVLTVLAEGPAGAEPLLAAVGRRNRSKLRALALEPLLAKGLLAMTLPDKPRSSRQQYRITDLGRAALAAKDTRR
jgi:ATP-dependent DNA helicase RecG